MSKHNPRPARETEQQVKYDDPQIVANHTGYRHGENFEHDDKGSMMNFSGCHDEALRAAALQNGWEPGYDFDEK